MLADLLAPMSVDDFVSRVWPRHFHVAHGDPRRLPDLFFAEPLQDLRTLASLQPPKTQVWWGEKQVSTATVAPEEALKLYSTGRFTVQFQGVDQRVSAVREAMEQVSLQLATPMHGLFCNAYVSPAGMRTALHFDAQEVFIVQIRGKKRWGVAKNASVTMPSFGYAGGDLGWSEAAQMQRKRIQRPRRLRMIEMSEGSVMYLPRGYWHETVAIEESIALTLTFPSMTWSDVAVQMCARGLPLSVEWRHPAIGLVSPLDDGAGLARLDRMLKLFGKVLAEKGLAALVPTRPSSLSASD